jgi:hypothetical protein
VKIGKSATEMLAPLALAYGEYTRKTLSVFEWHRWFKESGDVQEDPKVQTLVSSDQRSVLLGRSDMLQESVWRKRPEL